MPARTLRVAEIALRVLDLDKMVAFYRDEIGLAPHMSLDGVEFLEIGPLETPLGRDGHPTLLALFRRDAVDASVSTMDHLAFEVSAEDHPADYARFAERGMIVHERAWPDTLPWKGKSFFIRDPEDNVIELIAALDESGK